MLWKNFRRIYSNFMITYEKAKELKENGFPQKEITPSDVREAMDYEQNEVVTFPTLSELIESCGDGFCSLHLCARGFKVYGWRDSENEVGIDNFEEVGLTPEEAVANLYLALNKK